MEAQRQLRAEPASAGQARRFTEATLRRWHHEDCAEVLTLLVSELVTNAILHAASDVRLRLVLEASAVRAEVYDASPVLPAARHYDDEAATGRGLDLVELVAESWGAEPLETGKVVWCSVPITGADAASPGTRHADAAVVDPGSETSASTAHPRSSDPPTTPATVAVQLRGLSIRLYRAMQQHNDALLRETALVAFGDGVDSNAAQTALSTHAAVVGAVAMHVDEAAADGWTSADLTARLSVATLDAVPALADALATAEALAARDALLTPAALPEVRACRDWLLGEVIAQRDGETPTPWQREHRTEQVRDDLLADIQATAVLDCLSDAVVVGDEGNRIAYANAAAEELLGWPADELVGRRITTIIPERLRDAHIAGYTRYLVTGNPRLIGTPVRVPARRRDGSEVAVELMLTAFRLARGKQAFVGSLREVTARTGGDDTALRAAVDTLRDVVGVLHGPSADSGELAERVLDVLGRGLAWRFAALWGLDDGALRCEATWLGDEAAFMRFDGVSQRQRFAGGVGLPGRVLASGEPLWVPDVVADTNFPRASAAVHAGLRTGVAVPVVDRNGDTVGVLELYTDQMLDRDPGLLTVLATAGAMLGALRDYS